MTDDAKKQRSKLVSAFKKRVKTLFTETLEPLGFRPVPQKRYRWERASETAPQYCNFRYDNSIDVLFISYGYRLPFCRDCWSNAPCDVETQKTLADFFQGLDLVEINGLEYFERAIERCEFWDFEANVPNDVEDKFAKVEKRFREKVVPFLERNRALEDVVNNYDAGSCESAPPGMRFDDFRFGVARFLLGQYAEAAAHFEAEAEKTLADDLIYLPYWQRYAKALQIGALSVRQTIEAKGPGPRPPKPKQRRLDLAIPAELVDYPNRTLIYELLEATESPYQPVATKALKELAHIQKAEKIAPSSKPTHKETAETPEARQDEAERKRILFHGTPEEKEALERYKAQLQKHFREKFKETLAPQGFASTNTSATFWENATETLVRYCRFSFHKGYRCLLDFGYTMKPDFSLWETAPQDAETQEVIANWQTSEKECFESGAANAWRQRAWTIPTNDGEFEAMLNDIDKALSVDVFPFFNRFRETSDVLRAVDAEVVDESDAIAEDEDWRLYYLAILRFQAGRLAEAADCLRQLVARTPPEAPDWEVERAEVARIGILALEKTLAERNATPIRKESKPKREIPKSHALCSNPGEVRTLLKEAESPRRDVALDARKLLYESAEYTRRLPEILAKHLEPQGFTRSESKPTVWARETQTLVQRCFFTVEPTIEKYFELEFSYRLKPDFTPWANVPNDAESQETLERFKTLVEKRLSSFDLKRDFWCSPIPGFRLRAPGFPTPPEAFLNALDATFTSDVLPFFDRWRESSDILAAYDADKVDDKAFGSDAATQNFVRALFLFQSGRYVESANRFDSLAHSLRKPNVYSDAAWATLLEGARLAAASVRKFDNATT